MYPHRIRLRGPWDYQPLTRTPPTPEPLPPAGRMNMPCRWGEGGLKDFTGRVRLMRCFGQPQQIDAHEHVWLTFGGVEGVAEVWLNGQLLGRHEGTAAPFEFEATELLRARNELAVEVEADHPGGGLWGEVALEIRCAAFLRAVRAWTTAQGEPRLHVAGEVVGRHEAPLELYVLRNNTTVHYGTVLASPGGTPFLVGIEEPAACGTVRVELVNGAIVWYAVEAPVT
jgi:hypothetical protein